MICAGGASIPTRYDDYGRLKGVEAVMDEDLCSALLAEQLQADPLIIATDVEAAHFDFDQPTAQAQPDVLQTLDISAGAIGPEDPGRLRLRPTHRQGRSDQLAGRHREHRQRHRR